MGRKKHIIRIDTPEQKAEVLRVFESLNSKNQIHIYYGISDNKQGSEYVKHIAQEIGFDLNTYKIRKQKPKRYCLECGKELIKKTNEKFCSSSCAALYNNRRKGSQTEDTKKKISESLKKYYKNISDDKKKIRQNLNKDKTKSLHKDNKIKIEKSKRYCLECGKELKNSQKRFCCCQCFSQHIHKQTYQYYLEHQDEFCRANYSPHPFYDFFLEEQNHKCALCLQTDTHNGKTLRFVIDHIDGDASNNHRDNLRLVCPNCDSQLDTFKSKNKNSKRRNYWKEKIIRKLKEENDNFLEE